MPPSSSTYKDSTMKRFVTPVHLAFFRAIFPGIVMIDIFEDALGKKEILSFKHNHQLPMASLDVAYAIGGNSEGCLLVYKNGKQSVGRWDIEFNDPDELFEYLFNTIVALNAALNIDWKSKLKDKDLRLNHIELGKFDNLVPVMIKNICIGYTCDDDKYHFLNSIPLEVNEKISINYYPDGINFCFWSGKLDDEYNKIKILSKDAEYIRISNGDNFHVSREIKPNDVNSNFTKIRTISQSFYTIDIYYAEINDCYYHVLTPTT